MDPIIPADACPRVPKSAPRNAMLGLDRWAVLGNHGKNAVCKQLMDTLTANGKTATAINPYKEKGWKDALAAANADVVNLVVNPAFGPAVIERMAELGIRNVFIQPGAADAVREAHCNTHVGTRNHLAGPRGRCGAGCARGHAVSPAENGQGKVFCRGCFLLLSSPTYVLR